MEGRGAAGGGAAGGGSPQPELLQQLYTRVEAVGTYLQRTLRPAAPRATLLRDDDPHDYRYVLERCLVAERGGPQQAPPSPQPQSAVRHTSTQPEVVRHVIEALFRESAQPEHVLALGHCRPRIGGTSSASFHGVERLIPNSAASALQTAPWSTLCAPPKPSVPRAPWASSMGPRRTCLRRALTCAGGWQAEACG